jgi:hypothetical protein
MAVTGFQKPVTGFILRITIYWAVALDRVVTFTLAGSARGTRLDLSQKER